MYQLLGAVVGLGGGFWEKRGGFVCRPQGYYKPSKASAESETLASDMLAMYAA